MLRSSLALTKVLNLPLLLEYNKLFSTYLYFSCCQIELGWAILLFWIWDSISAAIGIDIHLKFWLQFINIFLEKNNKCFIWKSLASFQRYCGWNAFSLVTGVRLWTGDSVSQKMLFSLCNGDHNTCLSHIELWGWTNLCSCLGRCSS